VITVTYQFRVPYLRRIDGSLFPGLIIELQNPVTGAKTTPIRAELDSGAEYSLFEGELARHIGLEVFDGEPFAFRLASGTSLESRILPIVLCHRELDDTPLLARFSTAPIPTNILGRDFFDFFRVGFDEHHSEVYLSALR
jgi:hypothetical protein